MDYESLKELQSCSQAGRSIIRKLEGVCQLAILHPGEAKEIFVVNADR